MHIDNYLECLKNKTIPPTFPDGLISGGGWNDEIDRSFDNWFMKVYEAREKLTKKGLWTVIDQKWTKILADWIGDRKCIEIMAGAGWLAKALSESGIDIVATDNDSWTNKAHTELEKVYLIECLDAVEAVSSNYKDRDILIVSWPPYNDDTICEVCEKWGTKKPIVYIGEGEGGCNAPDDFWKRFKKIKNTPDIPMVSWDGIHDYVTIGKWGKAK